jgi:hypothetical protein
MKVKKVLALVLVLVAVLAVCVSCAGGGQRGPVTYKVKNNTVEDLAIVIFKEKIDKGQTWTITNMVPEQEGEFTLYTNLNNGAPDLQFKVINKAGTEFATDLNQKGDKIINIISDPDSLGKLTIQLEDKN